MRWRAAWAALCAASIFCGAVVFPHEVVVAHTIWATPFPTEPDLMEVVHEVGKGNGSEKPERNSSFDQSFNLILAEFNCVTWTFNLHSLSLFEGSEHSFNDSVIWYLRQSVTRFPADLKFCKNSWRSTNIDEAQYSDSGVWAGYKDNVNADIITYLWPWLVKIRQFDFESAKNRQFEPDSSFGRKGGCIGASFGCIGDNSSIVHASAHYPELPNEQTGLDSSYGSQGKSGKNQRHSPPSQISFIVSGIAGLLAGLLDVGFSALGGYYLYKERYFLGAGLVLLGIGFLFGGFWLFWLTYSWGLL